MKGRPKVVRILGTRGVPAAHGGFETFAEYLACYLVARGWRVIVYCQEQGGGPIYEDKWNGVDRVRIPIDTEGPRGTVIFDWKCVKHAAQHRDLCLTLGYNTAIFCAALRIRKIPNLINMDGIEWKRRKWGAIAKTWFYLNDWAGCWLGNHLIADHPEIKRHLSTRVSPKKITTIPYGADLIDEAGAELVTRYGLEPGKYLTLIARAEPENSVREVVSGFSRKVRGMKLAVLGNYDTNRNPYHRAVRDSAGREVSFLGAIYDKAVVSALRFHSLAYVHGHQVGGTNPSLVEAMGAGNAILAHDNPFNRWVIGDSARFFSSSDQFSEHLEYMLSNPATVTSMRTAMRARHAEFFTWDQVLSQYEALLTAWQKDS